MIKNLPTSVGDAKDTGRSLGGEDPLEEGMATQSGILAWNIPWTEQPDSLWGHNTSNTTEHPHRLAELC